MAPVSHRLGRVEAARAAQQLVDREREHVLGVRAPVHVVERLVAHALEQVSAHLPEVPDVAVVHEEIGAVPERMAVGLVHGARLRRRAHVREDAAARDDAREVAQVAVVPRGCDGAEDGGLGPEPRRVPADAEAVAVERLVALARVRALADERVLGVEQQRAHADGRTEVEREAAHARHSGRAAGARRRPLRARTERTIGSRARALHTEVRGVRAPRHRAPVKTRVRGRRGCARPARAAARARRSTGSRCRRRSGRPCPSPTPRRATRGRARPPRCPRPCPAGPSACCARTARAGRRS